jgi:hypothetical protein
MRVSSEGNLDSDDVELAVGDTIRTIEDRPMANSSRRTTP